MNSLEFTKPITTESLLKEFESRFNMTMDLSKFNEEELQDYANHVRTKIHEITQNTHFGQELKALPPPLSSLFMYNRNASSISLLCLQIC